MGKPKRQRRRGKGEGTISPLPDGTWWGRLTVPTENGKQKRKAFYGQTRTEVFDKMVAFRQKPTTAGGTTDQTVEEYLWRWHRVTARELVRDSSHERYEAVIRRHLVPNIGIFKLRELDTKHVENMLARLVKEKLSGTTRKLIVVVLNLSLKHAVRQGMLPANPLDKVAKPRVGQHEFNCWTLEQTRRFLAATRGHTLHPLLVTALDTGMRRGELYALHREDVDLAKREVHVRWSVRQVTGRQFELKELKTKASRRTIVMAPHTADVLREHLRTHTHDLVFATRRGNYLQNMCRRISPLFAKAGVPPVRFHDFRHISASLLLASGVPIKVVSERLGHANITTTLHYYAHVLPHQQRQAGDQIGGLLFGD